MLFTCNRVIFVKPLNYKVCGLGGRGGIFLEVGEGIRIYQQGRKLRMLQWGRFITTFPPNTPQIKCKCGS